MKLFIGISLVIAMLNGSPSALYAQAAPPAHLTQAQAIAIASDFCKAVGAPETGTPTAVYPAPPYFPGEQEIFYAPRWLITYPDQTEVEVVDSLRNVSRYHNNALTHQLDLDNQPAGIPISQSKVLQVGKADLKATG